MKSCPNDFVYTNKRIYRKNEMKSFFLFVHIEWLKDQKLCNKGFFKAKVNDLEKLTNKKIVVYGLSQCTQKILNKIADPFNKTIVGEGA